MMLTTDMALRLFDQYAEITKRWLEHPDELADAFAKAWFKLTHRDMGPISRYVGAQVPTEPQIWQDPVPAPEGTPIDDDDVAKLKQQILDTGVRSRALVALRGPRRRHSAGPTSVEAPTAPASVSPRRRTGRSTSPASWLRP